MSNLNKVFRPYLVKCWICKELYVNRKHIMSMMKCSDEKNHKVCYSCRAHGQLARELGQ